MPLLSNKKNYIFSLISSWFSQLSISLFGFITIPIVLDHLGKESYGIWALITSIIVYLNVSGIGLTTSASVLIAKNSNINDKLKIIKRVILLLLIVISFVFISFLLIDQYSINWINAIGDIPDRLKQEVHQALFWIIILFLLNHIITLSTSILHGFQKLYVDKNFTTFESFLVFAATLLAVWIDGNLVHLVVMTFSARIISGILRIIYIYITIFRKLEKNETLSKDNKIETSYKTILVTGLRFTSIGLAAMVVWNTDNLIISHFMSFEDVTPYSSTFKLYGFIFAVISIMTISILPILGKEIGNQNWLWINKVYQNLFCLIISFGGFFWLLGVLFLKDLIMLWIGIDGFAGLGVVFFFGGYAYLISSANLHSGMLNSFNFIKGIAYVGWLEALCNLCFSIILLRYWGLTGVAMGTFLGSLMGPFFVLPYLIKRRTNGLIKPNYGFQVKHFVYIIIPLLIAAQLTSLYLTNFIVKLFASFIILVVYFVLSYIVIPQETKLFFIEEIQSYLKKI